MSEDLQQIKERLGTAARALLITVGSFYKDDHVVLSSGPDESALTKRHSDKYVNHDPLFEGKNRHALSDMGGLLAELLIYVVRPNGIPGALVGPVTGGWNLSHWAGHHYRISCDSVPSVPAEKKPGGGFILSANDSEVVYGKRVYIVDDVLTSGKTVRQTQQVIEDAGGTVEGVIVVCDRSGKTAEELGIKPVWSLFTEEATSWAPDECPMCKEGKPVNVLVGHGKAYLEAKAS